ncbi:hypothetical protein ACFVYE_40785 [Streptomyces sp. NPDC058239]
MGEIRVDSQHLDRPLTDSTSSYGAPYQKSFAELAATRRGQ